ncbi:TPA: hypothetical protein NKO30_006641 [Pseudomonas aeruginosa]|nr:hypothetical protein [Pseudomonas aeruginosa]
MFFDALPPEPMHVVQENSKQSSLAAALATASRDFERRIRSERTDWEFGQYVSRIENYSVGMAVSGSSFLIIFRLRKNGRSINGGGATYLVDNTGEKILKFTGEE